MTACMRALLAPASLATATYARQWRSLGLTRDPHLDGVPEKYARRLLKWRMLNIR